MTTCPVQWLQMREDAWARGHLRLLPVLLDGVDKSTQRALRSNSYTLGSGKNMDLSRHRCANPVVKWLGKANAAWLTNSAIASCPKNLPRINFWPMEEPEVTLSMAGKH